MSLDTEIPGTPGSIETAATWLEGDLHDGVDGASTALVEARRAVGDGWEGEAASSFHGWSGDAVGIVDELVSGIDTVSSLLVSFAGSLRSAQSRMAGIRERARAGGLTVAGFVIQDPGAGPTDPGVLPEGATAPQGHAADVAAFDAHQDKIWAWNAAVLDAGHVQDDIAEASERLQADYHGLEGHNWFTAAGDLLGGLGGAVMEFQASILKGTSDELLRTARTYEDVVKNADPAIVGRGKYYDDLKNAADDIRRLEDLGRNADELDARARGIPLKLGGALTVLGIGMDIASGKDPVQATASGVGGFAASVGAGALIGTAIGGPVGTAVGAVVGAGVGIFTSGMIDGLFEHDGDISKAFDQGIDSVVDTGEAIGGAISDGVGGVVDGIGGLFD